MGSQDIQLTSRKFHELEQETPPTPLFHYTGQKGLLGIIKSGEFWASKVQYMNDSTEFGYGITLAKELIDKRKEKTGKNGDLFKLILQRLDGTRMINICAVSFCRDGDLLSQWRGYAGTGGGYAIGFYPAALSAIGSGRLGHCIYEKSDQVQILNELIDQMLEYTSKLSPTADLNGDLTDAFVEALTQYGAFFKDKAFKEEEEWRLVTGVLHYDDEKFEFRDGRSTPIPYYRLNIHNGSWDGNGKIDTIVVGPCPHPDAAKVSVIGLLMRYSVSSRTPGPHYWPEVQISAIPYRNW